MPAIDGGALILRLSADKAEYGPNEIPALELQFRNETSGPLTITTAPDVLGLIVSRDGAGLVPARITTTAEPAMTLAERRLETLLAREALTVPLYMGFPPIDNPGFATPRSLFVVRESGANFNTAVYDMDVPGTYIVAVVYKYSGPDNARPRIYRARVVSNLVTFRRN